jgi:Gram-negative bacterial TonB protein C-terminal
MTKRNFILISLYFCFNLLITDSLSAQNPDREYKMVAKDSMKYAINERGDTIFRAKIKGDNLRLVIDGKRIFTRIINDKDSILFEETIPEYPNGNQEMFRFLASQIRYPKEARESGAQGNVFVAFIINADGSVSDVYVKKIDKIFKAQSEEKRMIEASKISLKHYKAIEEEAIRVVKLMPKWKPGMQQNRPVRVAYTLPIKFKLD